MQGLLSFALFSVFAAVLVVPLLLHWFGPRGARLAALLPAGLFCAFAWNLAQHEVLVEQVEWVPSLGVEMRLLFDGLAGTYALLICGIGALVVLFAAPYGIPARQVGGFDSLLFLFMGSMLGLVLADDVISLFLFWELTSVASYLLIGFRSDMPKAIASARQALLLTSSGGLAMLAGLLLLSEVAGTRRISEISVAAADIVASPSYLPILGLIALGAFSKSAIFPFHFWLPNAMTAPTPVSAYLHSATMVKAGIYLLTRLRPTLGGTEQWFYLLAVAGTLTVVIGAVRLVSEQDLKRVLAQTTVIGLGALTLLVGLPGVHPVQAFAVFLVVHALYKAALFMIAGIVDYSTHTLDVRQLGGLRRRMRVTFVGAVLASIAMIGMPPMLGFIGKELVYEATLHADPFSPLWTGVALIGNVAMVCGALIVAHGAFFGKLTPAGNDASDPPGSMLAGPLVLGVLSLLFGVFHHWIGDLVVQPNVLAIENQPIADELSFSADTAGPLILSVFTIALGVAMYWFRGWLARQFQRIPLSLRPRTESVYDVLLRAMQEFGAAQTRFLQSGRLRTYVLVVLAAGVAALALSLTSPSPIVHGLELLKATDYAAAGVVLLGIALARRARQRLTGALGVAIAGYGIGVLFAFFGAVDVALAQYAAESLLLLAVVLASATLRPFDAPRSSLVRQGLRALFALSAGAVATWVVLRATAGPFDSQLSEHFVTRSLPDGHGRNVVNTILVDFRALDTLGEITVLFAAVLAIWPLVRGRCETARDGTQVDV